MSAKDLSETSATRRKLLGSMASPGALLGLDAPRPQPPAGAAETTADTPEKLLAMARLRNYKARRSSSWDRSGGNNDAVPVEAGPDRHHARRARAPAWSPTSGSPSIRTISIT